MPSQRIGILVVHGVGEQKCFEHLEDIASNLYKALCKDPRRKAHLQIGLGDTAPLHSPKWSWQEAPVSVHWTTPSGDSIEAVFREVHWADVARPMSWWTWICFVSWAMAMPGVRLYNVSPASIQHRRLRQQPRGLTWWEQTKTRFQLFGVSLAFLLMMLTINLANFVLTRFSIHSTVLKSMRSTLYGYVGDVKLYQDWYVRNDNYLGAIGEKSRFAIRRRMVNALVRTAKLVRSSDPNKKLDGYYIFAHSLGTVVAFNGLMELAGILPRYLTQADWVNLEKAFKANDPGQDLWDNDPKRPPWIDPKDQINRSVLFEGLRGFLTMGSPLDKFAALWPVIVSSNAEPLPNTVPWINVADRQDIVGGSLDLFPDSTPKGAPAQFPPRVNVGGLELRNIMWADQFNPFTAHTSYWKVRRKKDRLIDGIVLWLEGREFTVPVSYFKSKLAVGVFWFWVGVAVSMILGIIGTLPWLGAMWTAASKAHEVCAGFGECTAAMLGSLADIMTSDVYRDSLFNTAKNVLIFAVCTITLFSITRWFIENWWLGDWERKTKRANPALFENQS